MEKCRSTAELIRTFCAIPVLLHLRRVSQTFRIKGLFVWVQKLSCKHDYSGCLECLSLYDVEGNGHQRGLRLGYTFSKYIFCSLAYLIGINDYLCKIEVYDCRYKHIITELITLQR